MCVCAQIADPKRPLHLLAVYQRVPIALREGQAALLLLPQCQPAETRKAGERRLSTAETIACTVEVHNYTHRLTALSVHLYLVVHIL